MDPRPAIVKSARTDLIAQAISIDKVIVKGERTCKDNFIELGKTLWKIKAECQHGEWEKSLEDMGIPSQRCSLAMRAVKLPGKALAEASSINDLRKALMLEKPGEDPAAVEREPGIEDNQVEEVTPNAPSLFCRPCRVGGPRADCPQCARLRGEEREKTAKVKQGAPVFDWTTYDTHYGAVMRSLDDLGRKYPEAKTLPEFIQAGSDLDSAAKHVADLRQRLLGGRRK